MTFQTLSRPVPQALLQILATISLARTRDTLRDQIDALPGHLRRDLGLAATRQSIMIVNDMHQKHSLD
jgi:hypothetical protein